MNLAIKIKSIFEFFSQALVYCIESCYFLIAWGLHYLENDCDVASQETYSVNLQKKLFKFMDACTELVPSNLGIKIQEAVNNIANIH